MSAKKKRPVRRKQASRAQNEGTATRRRGKGMTPAKAVLLFLVVIGLAFAAAAIFGDPASNGRVWSEAHQHWHSVR